MGLFRRRKKTAPDPVRVEQLARLHAAYDAELDILDRADDFGDPLDGPVEDAHDDEFRRQLRQAGARIAATERNSSATERDTARQLWPWT